MHRRFEGARKMELRCPGGTVVVAIAESSRLRLLGLTRLRAEEIEPLLFPNCRSIHMHGMRTAIDLVWLADDGDQKRVLEIVESLEPGRRARAPRGVARRTVAALELAPGEATRLDLVEGATLTCGY